MTFSKHFRMLPILILISCQPLPSEPESGSKSEIAETDKTWTAEELELQSVVERFLTVAGNFDLAAMDSLITEKANLGIGIMRDGEWVTSVITIEEYFESVRNRAELRPFYEPVRKWTIEVNQGQLAFVGADAVLYRFGVPLSRNNDYFTLIRQGGEWKFMNLSFTNLPLSPDSVSFSPEAFARGYAQAWSGIRPEFVAAFFAEDGSLRVNDGEAAIGREAIAGVARGFMTDLPDMVVRYDSLINTPAGTEFHWTLIATHAGTGNPVNVSGYEEWQLEEGRIKTSQGHFPSDEYQRQVEGR